MENEDRRWGISQETLKLIACAAMLTDHIGEVLQPLLWLRVIGRLAFPIYCWLLVEGFHKTKNVYSYMDRLLIGALLSEIPFDLAVFGSITSGSQNVMLTMLLGLLALQTMACIPDGTGKLLAVLPILWAAERIFRVDYGAWGVALIVLLEITRERKLYQMLMILLFCAAMPNISVSVLGVHVSVQLFGAAAILPICLYSGQKRCSSKTVQRMFYLFYPAHLLVLYLVKVLTA